MLGFITIQQIGSALLALSLNEIASPALPLMGLFFAQLLTHSIGLAAYSYSLICSGATISIPINQRYCWCGAPISDRIYRRCFGHLFFGRVTFLCQFSGLFCPLVRPGQKLSLTGIYGFAWQRSDTGCRLAGLVFFDSMHLLRRPGEWLKRVGMAR